MPPLEPRRCLCADALDQKSYDVVRTTLSPRPTPKLRDAGGKGHDNPLLVPHQDPNPLSRPCSPWIQAVAGRVAGDEGKIIHG